MERVTGPWLAVGIGRARTRTPAEVQTWLAEQARDAYATLGDAKKTDLTEVQAWLADHRLP